MESLQTNPSLEYLNVKITTRVLAAKLHKQSENSLTDCKVCSSAFKSGSSIYPSKSRQVSRFLVGAAVPNSIIKSQSQNIQPLACDDKNIRRARRDAEVKEIINRMEQKMKSREEILYLEDFEEDESKEKSPNDMDMLKKESYDNLNPTETKTLLDKDASKEKERISRRTGILAPLRGQRRSTYDEIKKAIENSKVIQQLINADIIEEQRMKINSSKKLLNNASSVSPLRSLSSFQPSTQPSSVALLSSKEEKKPSQKLGKASLISLKKKLARKSSKSILKTSLTSMKPTRTVSIVESRKEDSQTQTYLHMNHFSPSNRFY